MFGKFEKKPLKPFFTDGTVTSSLLMKNGSTTIPGFDKSNRIATMHSIKPKKSPGSYQIVEHETADFNTHMNYKSTSR